MKFLLRKPTKIPPQPNSHTPHSHSHNGLAQSLLTRTVYNIGPHRWNIGPAHWEFGPDSTLTSLAHWLVHSVTRTLDGWARTLHQHTKPPRTLVNLAQLTNSQSWPTRTVDQRWPRTVSSHSQLAHWLWPTLTNSHTENLTFYTSKVNSHSLPQTTFWIQLPIAHFFWSRTVWKVIFLTNLPPTLVQTPKHLKNSTKTDQNIKFSSVLHIFKLFFVFFILFFKNLTTPPKIFNQNSHTATQSRTNTKSKSSDTTCKVPNPYGS